MDLAQRDDRATLFFDVDGTIIHHPADADTGETVANAVPTPAVVSAFHRLRDEGHHTFICTGRPLCLVSQALRDLQPTGLVTSAGACLVIDGKVASEEVIPEDVLVETIERIVDAGAQVLLEGTEGCVALVPSGEKYHGIPGVATARDLDGVRRVSNMRFCKFSYEDDQLDRVCELGGFLDRYFVRYDLGLGCGEACLIGLDKATGVRRALEHLGIGFHNTYAFGDSENDLPMLRAVETPVAMGNALQSVKDAAVYVTRAVEEDGVPAALEHFGLL